MIFYRFRFTQDRARNASERLSATTTLTINIEDSDDLDPSFIYRYVSTKKTISTHS